MTANSSTAQPFLRLVLALLLFACTPTLVSAQQSVGEGMAADFNAAISAYQSGDYLQVIQRLDRIEANRSAYDIDLGEAAAFLDVLRAGAYAGLGEPAKAQQVIDRIDRAQLNAESLPMLDAITAEVGQALAQPAESQGPSMVEVQETFAAAIEAYESGNYSEALSLLDQIDAEMGQPMAVTEQVRAASYYKLGDLAAAQATIDRIENNPDFSPDDIDQARFEALKSAVSEDLAAERRELARERAAAAETVQAAPEGAAESSSVDEASQWHRIKYECYAADAQGLDLRQEVVSSDSDSLTIRVHLRFVDLHPRYHRNVLIYRMVDDNNMEQAYEPWIAVLGAGSANGSQWVSPPIRIPRGWTWEANYGRGLLRKTATWDETRGIYDVQVGRNSPREFRVSPLDLFGVKIECYQYDPDPAKWREQVRLGG